jgi:hypothetical protein
MYPQTVFNSRKHEIIHEFSCLFLFLLKEKITARLLKASRTKRTAEKMEFLDGTLLMYTELIV